LNDPIRQDNIRTVWSTAMKVGVVIPCFYAVRHAQSERESGSQRSGDLRPLLTRRRST